jgi:hypothetical protein
MTNAPSGGDGPPSSPEGSLESWSPPNGPKDDDCSKTNPSGSEKELNLGATAMPSKMTTSEENIPQETNLGLFPIKKVPNEEQKEETEESMTTEAMDIEKNLDGALDGMSLASISADNGAPPYTKVSQAPTETALLCHQTIFDSISEEFKTEKDDEKDNLAEETATIIPSASDITMKEYQMKLLVPKKNKEEYLIGVNR